MKILRRLKDCDPNTRPLGFPLRTTSTLSESVHLPSVSSHSHSVPVPPVPDSPSAVRETTSLRGARYGTFVQPGSFGFRLREWNDIYDSPVWVSITVTLIETRVIIEKISSK